MRAGGPGGRGAVGWSGGRGTWDLGPGPGEERGPLSAPSFLPSLALSACPRPPPGLVPSPLSRPRRPWSWRRGGQGGTVLARPPGLTTGCVAGSAPAWRQVQPADPTGQPSRLRLPDPRERPCAASTTHLSAKKEQQAAGQASPVLRRGTRRGRGGRGWRGAGRAAFRAPRCCPPGTSSSFLFHRQLFLCGPAGRAWGRFSLGALCPHPRDAGFPASDDSESRWLCGPTQLRVLQASRSRIRAAWPRPWPGGHPVDSRWAGLEGSQVEEGPGPRAAGPCPPSGPRRQVLSPCGPAWSPGRKPGSRAQSRQPCRPEHSAEGQGQRDTERRRCLALDPLPLDG